MPAAVNGAQQTASQPIWLQPFIANKTFYMDFLNILIENGLTCRQKYKDLQPVINQINKNILGLQR